MSNRLAVGPAPHIKVEVVEGDLRLVGWENDELLAKIEDQNDLTIQQVEDKVTLSSRDDLVINLPKGSKVQVETVNGDMSVRGLTGDLEVEAVHGDLAMRDVGSVKLGTIEADFSLRRAKGDVHTRNVGGDASLREINGSLALDSVSDDLAVRGVSGSLKVDVDGDIVLHLDPQPDQEYSVVAGDDIMVLLPLEANATLTIHADKIKVEWPGVEQADSASPVVTLGDGAAQVRLDAGGDVVVTNRVDTVESADEYGNFAGMMFDWGGFGRNLGDRISRRVQEVAERAALRAEATGRKAEVAGRRMERHLEGRFREAGQGGKFSWSGGGSRVPKSAKVEPVSDEERMTILRMLADKKITSEEAESLLSSLEGRE